MIRSPTSMNAPNPKPPMMMRNKVTKLKIVNGSPGFVLFPEDNEHRFSRALNDKVLYFFNTYWIKALFWEIFNEKLFVNEWFFGNKNDLG